MNNLVFNFILLTKDSEIYGRKKMESEIFATYVDILGETVDVDIHVNTHMVMHLNWFYSKIY